MPHQTNIVEFELDSGSLGWGGPAAPGTHLAEAVELENEFISATFVGEFGGRLVRLIDKATGFEAPIQGLGFAVDLREPACEGLARMSYSEEFLRLSRLIEPGGAGWHLQISLGEGAVVQFDCTLRNRSLASASINPGIRLGKSALGISKIGGGLCILGQGGGVAVLSKQPLAIEPGNLIKFGGCGELTPRWNRTIRFSLVPFAGGNVPTAVSESAVLEIGESALVLTPRAQLPGVKLVVRLESGQTLETSASLSPEQPLTYSFQELGGTPTGFAILGEDRSELLRWPAEEVIAAQPPEQPPYPNAELSELEGYEETPAYRYWIESLRTREAFRLGDDEGALTHAESALLYNGEDPIAWIDKAIAARRLGEVDESAPELPNAHYLSPHEPLLRSESYLSQPGIDGGAFFSAMSAYPEELIECACHYLSLGLMEDAATFLDAARSAGGAGMLRYLFAYLCLTSGRLITEAGAAVAQVKEFQTPYPFREVERVALEALRNAFPDDAVLAQYAAVADASSQPIHRESSR